MQPQDRMNFYKDQSHFVLNSHILEGGAEARCLSGRKNAPWSWFYGNQNNKLNNVETVVQTINYC